MRFHTEQKVLFRHCDPAGIVFYPRYFEMMNDAVEDFFDRALGLPFDAMHAAHGVPTVATATEFRAPSRHGDRLRVWVVPTGIGTTSMDLTLRATCGEEVRFETRTTLVYLDLVGGRPTRWPEAVRAAIEPYLSPEDDAEGEAE